MNSIFLYVEKNGEITIKRAERRRIRYVYCYT